MMREPNPPLPVMVPHGYEIVHLTERDRDGLLIVPEGYLFCDAWMESDGHVSVSHRHVIIRKIQPIPITAELIIPEGWHRIFQDNIMIDGDLMFSVSSMSWIPITRGIGQLVTMHMVVIRRIIP